MKCWYRLSTETVWHKGDIQTSMPNDAVTIVCQGDLSIPDIRLIDHKIAFDEKEMSVSGYRKAYNSNQFERVYVDIRFYKPKEVK